MHKLPRILRQKVRRPKPGKPDSLNPELEDEFEQANEEPVPHKHPGDPGAETDKGLLALDEIFKFILGEAAERLDEVNRAIAHFNETGTDGQYKAAIKKFNDFVDGLNDPTPKPTGLFGPTINAANIDPIQEDGSYISSARVVVEWLGGTHSGSSLIHVP